MSLSEVGNFLARDPSKVDPALLAILQQAAAQTGMKVEAYSGYRPGDPRFHGKGLATDVRIIGPDGKALPNYQTPETFGTYQRFANAARQVQQEKYPQLSDRFRWGGYFGGGKGKYGAMDLMHFDLGGSPKLGMAGGSWDKGLTPAQAALYGLAAGGQVASASPYAGLPDGPKGQEAYSTPGLGGAPSGLAGATGAPGGILGDIPQDVADYAASPDPKPFGERLGNAFKALTQTPDAPPVRFQQMGDARQTGDSLTKQLSAPTMADLLLRKRLG